MLETHSLTIVPTPAQSQVSALLELPERARALLVLGHGAGSHLRHPLLDSLSRALHQNGVGTLRYNYPYSERGRGMDSEPVRLATVRAAVLAAGQHRPDLPTFAGGHSMSGRMTSLAESRDHLAGVRGIVFFAFPLHSGPPDASRAQHLSQIGLPLLFVSGTRDKMADRALLEAVTGQLKLATLHFVEAADHGFKVPKKRGDTLAVMDEIARVTASWMLSRLA